MPTQCKSFYRVRGDRIGVQESRVPSKTGGVKQMPRVRGAKADAKGHTLKP